MATRKHSARISAAGQQAWELLFQLFREIRANLAAASADLELTLAQARLLQDLDPGHPAPMTEIASAQRCDASNITGLVDKLETRGVIERIADPTDRRVKMIAVTKAGAELRQRLLDRLSEPPDFIADLSQADQRALRDILRKIVPEP